MKPRQLWLPGAGIRVHGISRGSADAPGLLLMLHGVAGNAHIWDAAAEALHEALGDSTQVVALDGRDGGLTDHPPSGYTPDDFAADLLAVHEALGARRLTLVGHSRGGWLAAYFTGRHPERVYKLVLVDPARLTFESAAASDRFFGRVREGLGPFPGRAAAIAWGRQHDPEGDWNVHRERGFLANYARRADGSVEGHLPASVVDELRRPARDDPVGPLLGRIGCPTLLLIGKRQSPERIRDKLAYAAAIPGCRVVELDASHFIHTDRPRETAALIAEFVQG